MKLILTIILLILLILYIFLPIYLVVKNFVRPKNGYNLASDEYKEFDEVNEKGRKWVLKHHPEEIFINSYDNLKLRALLQINNSNSNNFVICVHGYQSTGNLWDFGMLAQFYASENINCLFIDDRAHGKSQGKRIGFSVLDYKDVLSWINYLTNRFPNSKILLHGISMGGATVINTSGETNLNPQVKGIIADCPFSSAYDLIKHLFVNLYKLPSFILPACDFFMKIICGYHLKDIEPKERVKQCKIPLLLIHGDKDTFVPTYMSKEIINNATCDKQLLLVKQATHAKSYIVNKQLFEETLDNFIKKTLSK